MAAKKPAVENSVTINFEFEQETKNKVRFSEVVESGEWADHKVGKLYMSKKQHDLMDNPQNMVVTIARA